MIRDKDVLAPKLPGTMLKQLELLCEVQRSSHFCRRRRKNSNRINIKNKATIIKDNSNKAFFIEGQLRKWGE